MPERSAITQGIQVGVEAVPGTNVAANRLLNSLGIEPGIQVDFQNFRPQGQKFSSIIVPGREWVESGVSGVGSYSELIYMLSCLVNSPTPVQQGATTAYLWTYSPAARAEDTIKTLTVEQGGSVRAHKYNYGLFTSGSIDFSRAGVTIGGSMMGQRLQDAIALTGAPTAVEDKPILPQNVDVFADDTSGALGTTKLLRVLSAGWSFGDRFNPLWTLNSANTSFAAHVESLPSAQFRLRVEADAQGMGLLTTMRAGSTKFLRIAAISADLAGVGFPYRLTIDGACKVASVSEFSDDDGVYAIEWTFNAVYDSTWANAFKIELVNKQTAL